MEQIKNQKPGQTGSFVSSKILSGLSYLPFIILIAGISLYTLAAIFSGFQELPRKWLIAHSYLPEAIAYFLLVVHLLLSPGEALLVFSVACMKVADRKSNFLIGISCLIYYPLRLLLLFTLFFIFPIWLIFDLLEAFLLVKIYRSVKSKANTPATME